MIEEGTTREDIENSLDLLIAVKNRIQRLKKSLPISFFSIDGEGIGIDDIREIAETFGFDLVESEWKQSVACNEEVCKRLHFEYDGMTFCGFEYKRKDVEND